jgi:Acyl-CoA thioester hydrolase/BAAT N-terminal region
MMRPKAVRTRRLRSLARLALVALIATGCTSATAVHIDVNHRVALFDSPVAISVSGLGPGEQVTLTARASDCGGNTWVSNATFTAHSSGRVDLSRDAPTSGSYQGTQAMGLLW